MHRAGIFKSSVLVDVVNYAGWPLLLLYGFSMFAYPWIAGGGNWGHVQAVWDRWQTLNAGALAFVASLIAFNISRYNESRQRERDFTAAKAGLPSALSSLMEYCNRSAQVLNQLWEPRGVVPRNLEYPELSRDYREVMSNCIRHADPAIGAYLSSILVRLQVHEARLRDAIGETRNQRVVDRHTLIAYMLRLGELHVLLGNLFSFARGEGTFHQKKLTWDDFRGSYLSLDLEVDDLFIDENMNLAAFTKRWLARTAGQYTESDE